MEFGASPFAETRREIVNRACVLDTPTYRWLPAGSDLKADYWIRLQITNSIPEKVTARSL